MIPSIIHREPQPCIILDLRCTNCGPVRMAIAPEGEPPAEMPCPYCDQSAAAKQLGTGMTRSILPYFDFAPNVQALDTIQSFSPKARFINPGQLVCFSEDPEKYHFAKVEDVYTSQAHMKAGRPSVSFRIHGEEVGPVPHISGAETRPWWCWPDELPRSSETTAPSGETKPAPEETKLSGQCAKGKHPLCRARSHEPRLRRGLLLLPRSRRQRALRMSVAVRALSRAVYRRRSGARHIQCRGGRRPRAQLLRVLLSSCGQRGRGSRHTELLNLRVFRVMRASDPAVALVLAPRFRWSPGMPDGTGRSKLRQRFTRKHPQYPKFH